MLEMLRSRNRVVWPIVTTVVALMLFLSTLQTDISGSHHPYATDVGEIQNAFPRWGLIHHSGYPLYTAAGSLFTNALWLIGIEPTAGASLFSAIWGAVSVGLLCALALELDASRSASMLGALAVTVSQSVWVDSSLAQDPPRDGTDVLAQADSPHPVNGWYPTSLWHAGEVVRDDYLLTRPPGTSPAAIRVAMYQLNQDGSFTNTAWVSRPISRTDQGAITEQLASHSRRIEPRRKMRLEATIST